MQYVVFKLGEEHFAVETAKIWSINDMIKITPMPKAPAHIKGLINLRGSINGDIHLLLNIEPYENQNNIIILKVNEEELGIIVDDVEEVIDIDEQKLQKLEARNIEYYIKGVIELDNRLLTIIDIEKL